MKFKIGLLIIIGFFLSMSSEKVYADVKMGEVKTYGRFTEESIEYVITKEAKNGVDGEVWITDCSATLKKADIKEKVKFNKKNYLVVGIDEYAFSSNKELTEVKIHNGVVYICDSAFLDCINMQPVSLPDSVRQIGYDAFRGCKSLQKITIPKAVKEIEKSTFNECTALKSVTLGKSVTKLGDLAFTDVNHFQRLSCQVS